MNGKKVQIEVDQKAAEIITLFLVTVTVTVIIILCTSVIAF